MRLKIDLEGFDLQIPEQFARNVKRLLEQLVERNRECLRLRPLPPLYRSGVRYRTDAPGEVTLADAPTVYRRKWGHCAHLSCWLCAELNEQGMEASLRMKWAPRSDLRGRLYHVQVRLAVKYGQGPEGLGQIKDDTNHEGQILDPSRMLGMGRHGQLWHPRAQQSRLRSDWARSLWSAPVLH